MRKRNYPILTFLFVVFLVSVAEANTISNFDIFSGSSFISSGEQTATASNPTKVQGQTYSFSFSAGQTTGSSIFSQQFSFGDISKFKDITAASLTIYFNDDQDPLPSPLFRGQNALKSQTSNYNLENAIIKIDNNIVYEGALSMADQSKTLTINKDYVSSGNHTLSIASVTNDAILTYYNNATYSPGQGTYTLLKNVGSSTATFNLQTASDFNLTKASVSIEGSPVPIPGAVWLLGSGLMGLVGLRRKLRG